MSATDVSLPLPPSSAPSSNGRPAGMKESSLAATWLRVALVCAILLSSFALRAWQARRIEERLTRERLRPTIKLADIPLELGPWKGVNETLDPMIARATGADQIVTRRYVNQDTGVSIEVILLYGPAVNMYIHSPELCYPTAGFAQVAGPDSRAIKTANSTIPFRTLVYSKGEGGVANLQEVYYTWWYNGRWSPQLGNHKDFERIPSMYKVHLSRTVTGGENRTVGNPCERFLGALMPELERRMSESLPSTP